MHLLSRLEKMGGSEGCSVGAVESCSDVPRRWAVARDAVWVLWSSAQIRRAPVFGRSETVLGDNKKGRPCPTVGPERLPTKMFP